MYPARGTCDRGMPELAYSWRKVMLPSAGVGFGETAPNTCRSRNFLIAMFVEEARMRVEDVLTNKVAEDSGHFDVRGKVL